jgi:nucleoside-diphosphate-sugar epimerase
MNNLVIGNTSQLGYYFPDDYIKISSRNIDFNFYKDMFFDRIYLCFAEQRTFIEEGENTFIDINFNYTIDVIEYFKDKCNKIIYYSTTELWNNCIGPINLDNPFNYNSTPYIKSKELITNYIKDNYDNVIILYPFNFNSIHRKKGFLFSKIFDSIINETVIEIGDTYFYRDLLHPKYVVKESINAQEDKIIGSGRLTYVNDFIRDLYKSFNLNYDNLVRENFIFNLKTKRNIFYLDSKTANYYNLLNDTIEEIKKLKNV